MSGHRSGQPRSQSFSQYVTLGYRMESCFEVEGKSLDMALDQKGSFFMSPLTCVPSQPFEPMDTATSSSPFHLRFTNSAPFPTTPSASASPHVQILKSRAGRVVPKSGRKSPRVHFGRVSTSRSVGTNPTRSKRSKLGPPLRVRKKTPVGNASKTRRNPQSNSSTKRVK
eukprot:657918_1